MEINNQNMSENQKSFFDEWKENSLFEVIKRRCFTSGEKPETIKFPPLEEDAVPLCLHCLAPQEKHSLLCSKCGAPVGEFTNIMPYEYILSMGDGFRRGVDPNTKLTPRNTIALVLASLTQYFIFAPFYWYRLYRARHPKKDDTITSSMNEVVREVEPEADNFTRKDAGQVLRRIE